MLRSIPWLLIGLLLTVSPLADSAELPGVKPPTLQIELQLDDATFNEYALGEELSPLLMLLCRTDEGWQPAWGTARDANHNVHQGLLSAVEMSGSVLTCELDVLVARDARSNPGGCAKYTVEMTRGDDGVYRGVYTGTWLGLDVSGTASAKVLPKLSPLPRSFTPVGPGEHPRILFRKSDLADLRRKANTPLGEAALEKMVGAVGLSVKYQLTGDRKYAQEVIPPIEKMIERGLLSDQYGNNVGDRLEQTAIAYDLCYDAWPEDFKRKVESYLLWAGGGILRARRDTHQAVNWHVCSNWSSPLYTGAAFAGLALCDKQGPAPEQPPATNTGRHIDPAEKYQPGRGVPVFDFKSDEMSPDWIFAGGLKTDEFDGDPLASLGGVESARPQIGDTITFGGKTIRFAPVSEEQDKGYWANENYDGGKRLIDITNAVGREYFSTNYFYIVVRNDRDRWVRYEPGSHASPVYLTGVRLEPGEVAHISPGLYPMLVEAYIDQINPWGRQLMRPRLVDISEDEAQQLTAQQKTAHDDLLAQWEQRKDEWERLGGLDLECRDLFERSRHMMYRFCREAVGDGGMQAELTHYSGIAEKPPARYIAAHRQMFGYDVSPQPDIECLLPRKMFVHVYPKDGEPRALEINGTPHTNNDLFAALLPTVDPRQQGAVLWGWQRHAGFSGENWEKLVADHPVNTLLNYPLDMKPVEPARQLPLTWRADDFGFYGFRNRWRDGDDFVAQVFAKAYYIGGWNSANAGTFRLVGLGHVWATGSTDRNRHRWEESVVQLPDDPEINLSTCGRVTYVETQPNGSGAVSIDYSDIYAGTKMRPDGRKKLRLYSRYGNVRRDDAFIDLGMSGMRSIGVDYSGKSGSPCLVAMVDRIDGDGRKVWTWQLPSGGNDQPSDVSRTTTGGNTFVIRKDDGTTLQGTFACGHRPVVEVRSTTMTGGGGSTAGKTLQRPIHGVFAESGSGSDAFFFVATIQEGEPPKVQVSGKGLDAVVTVGKQRVRFDGEKIVFDPVR